LNGESEKFLIAKARESVSKAIGMLDFDLTGLTSIEVVKGNKRFKVSV